MNKGLVFCLILFASGPLASEEARTKLFVQGVEPKDTIGAQLVESVKAAVRKQRSAELTDQQSSSDVQIRVLTMDPDGHGKRSVYAVLFTATAVPQSPTKRSLFLAWTLQQCPQAKVASCADAIVYEAIEQAANYRSEVSPSTGKR